MTSEAFAPMTFPPLTRYWGWGVVLITKTTIYLLIFFLIAFSSF